MGKNKERIVAIMEQFIDEKIDLVLTLGDMLQQDECARMEKS